MEEINYKSSCPHCGTTLYGVHIKKCFKCGKDVDISARTEEARKKKFEEKVRNIANDVAFRKKHRTVLNACHSDKAIYMEFSKGNYRDIGRGVQSYIVKDTSGGKEAWWAFSKNAAEGKSIIAISCNECANLFLICIYPGPTSFSYWTDFGSDWFRIKEAFYDRKAESESWLKCPRCRNECQPGVDFYSFDKDGEKIVHKKKLKRWQFLKKINCLI